MDLYNHKKRFESILRRIKESDILPENKEEISKFKDHCLSEGISIVKVERYLNDLKKLAITFNRPFREANKEDIRAIVGQIEQAPLSAETKKGMKILLRKLYKVIRGVEGRGVYPDEVKWISTRIPENHRKLPEELLTEEEIKLIVQNCDNLRDKALVSTLAESGCRVGEIGLMKIKHISFEEYGARLTVNGKTGMRKILVINSTPYLQEWINQHPLNNIPESFLWYNSRSPFLCYARITGILKHAAKRAGIKKRIYPHLLRHSRATYLATRMSEASMKMYFGWTQSSEMASTYIHMSGKDTDEAILLANGVEVKKDSTKPKLEPKKCLRCKTINAATNRFCSLCGLILSQEEAEKVLKADTDRLQADQIMDKLLQDSEILELIKKKLS